MEVHAVVKEWNDMAKICGLPNVIKITDGRRMKIKRLIHDVGFHEILSAIHLIPDSDFLMGINDTHWKADFDWFINDRKPVVIKILEGGYGIKIKHKQEEIVNSYCRMIEYDERLRIKDLKEIAKSIGNYATYLEKDMEDIAPTISTGEKKHGRA